jgi:hypothetical protein
MTNCEIGFGVDENCSLDIFDMTTNTSELVKKLVNRKLLFLNISNRLSVFSNDDKNMDPFSLVLIFLFDRY